MARFKVGETVTAHLVQAAATAWYQAEPPQPPGLYLLVFEDDDGKPFAAAAYNVKEWLDVFANFIDVAKEDGALPECFKLRGLDS